MNRPRFRWGLIAALAAGLTLLAPSGHAAPETLRLNGAGATFPAPLYLRWFRDYHRTHPQLRPDYQGTGSASGIKDLRAGLLDFAGSDYPLEAAEAEAIPGGLVQIPLAAGAIALIYHLDGLDGLRLSREALLGLFSGGIERWNDPLLAAANPDLALPDEPVVLVVRAGASGSSLKFSQHLSAISPIFGAQTSPSMTPAWPRSIQQQGRMVAAVGNDGVAAMVRAIPGALGYVQYAYGLLPGLQMALLENRAGAFVAPGQDSFAAAVTAIRADRRIETLRDPDAADAYPIVGLSWLLLRRTYQHPAKLPALLGLIDYALGPGQQDTVPLGYIPFDAEGLAHVRALLEDLHGSPIDPSR
ncbi:MAG: phosphate ABC transporter substrate-binding protein PstS [Chromatiaceae bacterium]|nr:MAG: phosphate ABC transporter substrate-binding protein PstS [Chromatiaceae bacterium]